MKPISTYFITPPINTELTESDVSNQVSGANILHAPGDEHIVSNEASNASILQAPIEGFSV